MSVADEHAERLPGDNGRRGESVSTRVSGCRIWIHTEMTANLRVPIWVRRKRVHRRDHVYVDRMSPPQTKNYLRL
jgi:hypothetical protein